MVLALSEAGQRAATLGLAAAGALAVWFLLLGILALITRSDLPPAGPATSELGGRESPAVVSFLANRWETGHEAVPATLLDLAARKALTIDQVSPERFVVRLRSAVPEGLADYERQVLDHVRSLATDNVIPCEALTTGPDEQSKGWWKQFEKSVVADARRQGLSRSRWGKPALTALGIVAVVPACLAAAAFVLAPTEDSSSSSSDDDPIGAFLSVAAVGWMGLMSIPYALRAERHTPLGKEAAGRWLGLREYLDESESFDRAPPAAVAIWDRYLAYGAAMGVAAGAVRALPLGAESDREAWSSYGGHWHVVRVRYPVLFPPGWGQPPIVVALKGLFVVAVALVVARGLAAVPADLVSEFLDASRRGNWEPYAVSALAVAGAILLGLAVVVVRALVMLALAVPDLFTKSQVEGMVIRLRNNYLALDDGEHDRVRAWRVEPTRLGGAARGSVVRVTVSPRLGYVFAVEPVEAREPRSVMD